MKESCQVVSGALGGLVGYFLKEVTKPEKDEEKFGHGSVTAWGKHILILNYFERKKLYST